MLCEYVDEVSTRMAESLDKMLTRITEELELFNRQLKKLHENQLALAEHLNNIRYRIKLLEDDNSRKARTNEDCVNHPEIHSNSSDALHEIFITGIPMSHHMCPVDATRKILKRIKGSGQIVTTRIIKKNLRRGVFSLIATFGSNEDCERILKKKRDHRLLRARDVFIDDTSDSTINLNDVHPPSVYKLFKKVRRFAIVNDFCLPKIVNSKIRFRKSITEKFSNIANISDINKL